MLAGPGPGPVAAVHGLAFHTAADAANGQQLAPVLLPGGHGSFHPHVRRSPER